MFRFISKYKLTLAGVIAGAICGYAYYYYIGCTRGSCPITSKPLNSAAYGGLIGALVVTSFKKESNHNK
jgi:hypothetical protein